MEPRIQYAKTKDGVNIAFCAHGKGTPLVQMWNPLSHIRQQWEVPEFRAFYERLAQKRMLVQYDNRGTGLSERDVSDFSLEALALDIAAVADRLELERFALWGNVTMGPVAIAYAARHPERVSHLVLWCSYARGSDFLKSPEVQALARLMDNWELYTDTLAHYSFGWGGGELARQWGATIREGITQETMRAFQAQFLTFDVTDLLPQVRAPTLVLHRRQFRLVSVDAATDLASLIPNARLALLEGESGGPQWDSQAVLDAIDEFLAEGEEAAAPGLAAEDIHTILFTDVEGSTALTQRLGDAKARDLLRQHERMVREALKAHGGAEVKTMGDGFMASFSSATKALECAIAMQRAFAERNESAEEHIKVRVGLNAGEPIAEDDDLFGTAVNRAARITATAKGGEILVANVVRELAEGKDFLFADRGDTSLKGFDEPVRLFEVRWRSFDSSADAGGSG
jgi:class 3 adenylate cyclase